MCEQEKFVFRVCVCSVSMRVIIMSINFIPSPQNRHPVAVVTPQPVAGMKSTCTVAQQNGSLLKQQQDLAI